MKETIAGIILLASVIGLSLFFADDVQPDLSSDGGYEDGGTSGHPIWNN